MFRHILITTALMSFTLFATPSMGLADNSPIQSGQEEQTVELVSDSRARTQAIANKRAQATESTESVDCFYDANSASPDCAVSKPGQR